MSGSVRIPADVEREDQILGRLTARQVAILAGAGLALYGLYSATRTVLPLAVFLAIAVPVGVVAAGLALGRRDGMTLDRWVVAAAKQRLSPARRVHAPEGVEPPPRWLAKHQRGEPVPAELTTPVEEVTETGVVDLGPDGLAAIVQCGTVNFALRTAGEQEALVAAFARYLHSITTPIQLLVRTDRVDLSDRIADVLDRAPTLPHPALQHAAQEHADFLGQLHQRTELLQRQVLLVLRERASVTSRRTPARAAAPARRAAESRLARRVLEAVELLSALGITVSPLSPDEALDVLRSACNPTRYDAQPPSAGLDIFEEPS